MPKTLCVDFDGVIHSYTSGWQGANVVRDPPVPGAIEWLKEMSQKYVVCVHSSRFSRPAEDSIPVNEPYAMYRVADWLVRNGFDEINVVVRGDRVASRATAGTAFRPGTVYLVETKPAAWLSIDDRGWTFRGTFPTAEEVEAFRPWNKP